MAAICTHRLRKELNELRKNPVDNIEALPKESNILEWHYVLRGAKGSDFEGGYYHGTLVFPKEYPLKPPSIQMITPNGRFKTCTRLCLSMSDFHPETWNPMWSVGTILMGLYSFMLEDSPTYGSMASTASFKRKCAQDSLDFNCKNKDFCELFPEYQDLLKSAKVQTVSGDEDNESSKLSTNVSPDDEHLLSWTTLLAVLAAILACSWAFFSYIM